MSTQKSFSYLIELDKIFEEKRWKDKENYDNVFEALASFSNIIFQDDEEYDLILELLRNFHWVSLNDYYNNCHKLLLDLLADLNHRNLNIYVFPIIKRRHQNKVKSGSFVSYLLKSILPTIPNSEKIRFEDINTFEEVEKLHFKKSDTFLLVDDFIGSGETLEECLKEIRQINAEISKNLRIFTIAIRKETLEKNISNYSIYYSLEILKGISDYNTGTTIQQKKDLMKKIENRIFNNIREFSLGFQESESLITLLRTPDNTFPIFWNSYKKTIKLKPPFPRYEKV